MRTPAERSGVVLVSSMASDAHTWNLVFLQLVIEELGHRVVNLGPCVPDDVLVDACETLAPRMVVLSSVNGHGYQEGLRVIGKLRAAQAGARTPMVIGGKLDVSGSTDARHIEALMAAGFDAVFADTGRGLTGFRDFVHTVAAGPRELAEAAGAVG
jgi:methylaspartate mutase sigma subunit